MLNWELLRNPYNWIVVFLMVTMAVAGLTLLQPYAASAANLQEP